MSSCASTSMDSMASSPDSAGEERVNKEREIISLDSGDDMAVDENDSSAAAVKPGKKSKIGKGNAEISKKMSGKRKALAPSGTHAVKDEDDDDCVNVTSRPTAPKKAKHESVHTNGNIEFKNHKLVLKQSKHDWSRHTYAYKQQVSWREFIEALEDSPDAIPQEHFPLVALLLLESDKTHSELVKSLKSNLAPVPAEDEDEEEMSQIPAFDQLPNTVIAATIKQIAERVNHGFRDSSSDDPDDRDLPEGYHVVPTSLRLWRWELKPEAADTILPHLPEDMRQKMSTRLAERKGARAAARELLASLPEEEKVAILTKGIKTTIATLEKGKKAATVKEEDDVETPSKKPLSKAKAFTKNAAQAEDSETGAESSTKKKPGKPKKELTAEEQADKEEKERVKEEKKAALAIKKAETAAKKAEIEAKKAVKVAEKAEKEEKERKKAEIAKKQKNAFGAWLAKSGTSPVEALDRPTHAVETPARDSGFGIKAESPSTSGTPSCAEGLPSSSSAVRPVAETASNQDYWRTFKPFYVRNHVTLAPPNRFAAGGNGAPILAVRAQTDGMDVDGASSWTAQGSITEFVERAEKFRIPSKKPAKDREQYSVAELVKEMTEHDLLGNIQEYNRLLGTLRNPQKVVMKLLKFSTDARPGYHGTWTKKSANVSGRRPFHQDSEVLDYDYDSEAEWMEEDPNTYEDCEDDGADGESTDENEYQMDEWLAGDDEQIEVTEGYGDDAALLNTDEVDETSPFSAAINAAKKTVKSQVKRKKQAVPLSAVIMGPCWEDEEANVKRNDTAKKFATFKMQMLCVATPAAPLDPFAFVEKRVKVHLKSNTTSSQASSGNPGVATSTARPGEKNVLSAKKPMVPADLMQLFVATVQASQAGTKADLTKELTAAFEGKRVANAAIQRQIAASVSKVAKAERSDAGGCWEIVDSQVPIAEKQ